MYVDLYLAGEDAAPMYGYGEAALIFTVMERLLRFLWLWRGCSDSYGYGEAALILMVMERLLRFYGYGEASPMMRLMEICPQSLLKEQPEEPSPKSAEV